MGKRILIVDDDEMVLMAVNELLKQEGYEVHTVFSGADYTVNTGIDNHFLADITGESVYPFVFSSNTAVDVHIASQEADAGTGSIDDGVLFGMDAPAELVALAVWYFQLISQAEAMFEAVFGFPWRSHVSCGDYLVITDDDGSYGSTEAGASLSDLMRNP